jgi:hypothetical protein
MQFLSRFAGKSCRKWVKITRIPKVGQISKLLGHNSVATTQRYLNLDLNLEVTASDFVRL